MKFNIEATDEFYKQLDELDEKTKRILDNKLQLLKENPYRFKKLQGYKLKLFRIRFNVHDKAVRLVYTIIEPNVVLICFIARKKDYKDLTNYLKQFGRN